MYERTRSDCYAKQSTDSIIVNKHILDFKPLSLLMANNLSKPLELQLYQPICQQQNYTLSHNKRFLSWSDSKQTTITILQIIFNSRLTCGRMEALELPHALSL